MCKVDIAKNLHVNSPTTKSERYCIVLYCIVLYCIVLYCIVLYCIVLYCIVSYFVVIRDDQGTCEGEVSHLQLWSVGKIQVN